MSTIDLTQKKLDEEKRKKRENFLDRFIESQRRSFFPISLAVAARLHNASFEEKEAFFRAKTRSFMKIFAVVVALALAYAAYRFIVPVPIQSPPLAPELITIGQVQSLQLHESAFSTSTTVITSVGIYQVSGGVSATIGNEVKFKREFWTNGEIRHTSLCVESSIKPACYSIL